MSFIEVNWNFIINLDGIEESFFDKFGINLKCIREDIDNLMEDGQIKTHKYNSNVTQNFDEELKLLTDKNKKIRQNIDLHLEDISKQQIQYENYKKDQKLLSQEIIERHEAFLMAKKHYKRFLKMYCTMESKSSEKQVIYVQFFTESKKESENNSVRLVKCTKSGFYQLLSVSPKLEIEKEIQRILQETNDLPGLLCCIRQAFISMKLQSRKEYF